MGKVFIRPWKNYGLWKMNDHAFDGLAEGKYFHLWILEHELLKKINFSARGRKMQNGAVKGTGRSELLDIIKQSGLISRLMELCLA